MTQRHSVTQLNEYATNADFCQAYLEHLSSLYLLSLLLTADSEKAEQCLISGIDDAMRNSSVFKERAHFWARRTIIQNAVKVLRPRPHEDLPRGERWQLTGNLATVEGADPKLAPVLALSAFERFVFVVAVLEDYSVQECSLLLDCSRKDVADARSAAIRDITDLAIANEKQSAMDVTVRTRHPLSANGV